MMMRLARDQDQNADGDIHEDPQQPLKGKALLGLFGLSVIFGIAACATASMETVRYSSSNRSVTVVVCVYNNSACNQNDILSSEVNKIIRCSGPACNGGCYAKDAFRNINDVSTWDLETATSVPPPNSVGKCEYDYFYTFSSSAYVKTFNYAVGGTFSHEYGFGVWLSTPGDEQYDCFGEVMCMLPRAFSILGIFATFLSMFYVSRLANSIEIQRNQYLFTVTVLPGVLYVATVVSYFNDQLGEAENFGASFALYVVAIILVFFAFLVARKIKSVQVSNLAAYLAAQANQVDVPVPVPIGMPVPIQMQSSTPPPPPSYGDAIVGAPPPSQSENIGQKLRVLAQLKNDGILTETEFVNKKAELLSEM
eukprot:m.202751 g.202751  ORF g.202751 m.202751 type:complete len:366 (+) comp32835_c0_seq20:174-1271(+)